MSIKKWWLALNFQYRTVFTLFLVLLVIGIPAAILLIRTQQLATEANFQKSAVAIAEILREGFEQDMKINNQPHTQATLARATESGYIIKTLIISNAGQVITSSEPSDIGMTLYDPELTSAQASAETLIRTMEDKEHNEVMEVVLPIRNKPDCYGCHDAKTTMLGSIEVQLSTSLLALQTQRQVTLLIIIASVTILLVGLALTYTLRRAVVKPLANHLAQVVDEHQKEERLYFTGRLSTIGELASGIAHELNNPLTSVIGFSELLLNQDVPDNIREDLKTINKEAQRTAQIVRNLLTFARKHPEEKHSVNLNEVILKTLELRAYEQKVNNIQVITRFAPDLPEITANPFQLQQAFLNIIINAEYFMNQAHGRGSLTATTKRIDNFVRVSLVDDGPGIPQENLQHIFDPFFTTKEVGKGTGLGLSICHGIVTEHGGRIYAESEPGKGATFIVELPINQQAKIDVIKESLEGKNND
ncbi:MAG: hypothetical protein HY529_05280 [Chloroflexi bacterium]|nr:hypothetical protein [Chloroflexota bacterium]